MGEGALHVELPKATGEASGSIVPRRRARPVPLYDRIEPLRPAQDPGLHHRRLLEAVRQHHMRDLGAGIEPAFQFANVFQMAHRAPEIPEVRLPQPQPNIPSLHPVRAGQHRQEVPQQHEDPQSHQEENWIRRRRLVQQQRVLTGKFAENNLGNPRPAGLPDDPMCSLPRLQGNRAGGVRMDPMDRGRVDQWRRGVPGPEDGAAL